MRNYEVTFIVDPVLSSDEIKATAQTYVDMLLSEGCQIVHKEEMGLRQLAYPINKRSSGIYFCIEFQVETGVIIDKLELALRRDERIMRFLTAALDKFGVKYNDDKRNGKIGTVKKKAKPIAVIDTRASSAPVTAAVSAPAAESAPSQVEETLAEKAAKADAVNLVEETPVAKEAVVESTPEVEEAPVADENVPVEEAIAEAQNPGEPTVEETTVEQASKNEE